MTKWQYVHFIDELRAHSVSIEVFNPLIYSSPQESNDRLLEYVKKHQIDVFFTNVCYEEMLFAETLQHIHKIGIPTVSLRCDNLTTPFNDRILAPNFDLIWLTSHETKHLYEKWGCNCVFAPYAANPYSFYPSNQNNIRRACFIGTPYGSRINLLNKFTQNGIPVDLFYGKKDSSKSSEESQKEKLLYKNIFPSTINVIFNRLRFPEGRRLMLGYVVKQLMGDSTLDNNDFLRNFDSVAPNEQNAIYSRYSLSISSTSNGNTDVLRRPLPIINLRNFEIPMSGGIQFCRFNEELSNYFEDGKEIIFYHSEDELIDKANFILHKATDSDIQQLKENARLRAENEHSWYTRFTFVFSKLGLSI